MNDLWLGVSFRNTRDIEKHLYDTAQQYAMLARCYGHSSAVAHLDWNAASDRLRSNDLGHGLRFWDVPSGQPITDAKSCRDVPWATFRVTLGYHCQGIFTTAVVTRPQLQHVRCPYCSEINQIYFEDVLEVMLQQPEMPVPLADSDSFFDRH